MLGKLFKYDWKFFWKVPAIINLALVVITLLGVTSFVSPLWDIESDVIDTLLVTSGTFYYISIFACSIAVSVYTAIRFYRNIYTDEGYLTNTLPVTPRQIILSKLFVSVLWSFITGFVILCSIMALVVVVEIVSDDVNIFRIIFEGWADIFEFFKDLELDILVSLLLGILYVIVDSFFNILMMFSAISLGQMFTRHKVAGAIGWYFAEYVVVQFGSSISVSSAALYMFKYNGNEFLRSTLNPMLCGAVLVCLACSIGLYFITEYMLKKRLNLD